MKLIFLSLVLILQTTNAFAVTTGRYGNSRTGWGSPPTDESVQITVLPDLIRVTDLDNKIPYELRLNDPGEQILNPKLLTLLREQPGSRSVARMVQKVTITDAHVSDKGMITANFNIHGESVSPFGKLTTVLQLGAQVVPKTCPVEWNDYNNGTAQHHSVNTACLDIELGTHVGLISLSTGGILSEQMERGIGMIGDFVFKLYSPINTGASTLYLRTAP